jgi:hypothetical protein
MLVVALGEPKVPVTCCAVAGADAKKAPAIATRRKAISFVVRMALAPIGSA